MTLADGTRLNFPNSTAVGRSARQNRQESWKTWPKVVSSKVNNYYYPNAALLGPKGYRIIGGNEAKMVRAFEAEPKLVSSLVEKQWKLAGVFDLYGLVSNKTIMFDESVAVSTSSGKTYVG